MQTAAVTAATSEMCFIYLEKFVRVFFIVLVLPSFVYYCNLGYVFGRML